MPDQLCTGNPRSCACVWQPVATHVHACMLTCMRLAPSPVRHACMRMRLAPRHVLHAYALMHACKCFTPSHMLGKYRTIKSCLTCMRACMHALGFYLLVISCPTRMYAVCMTHDHGGACVFVFLQAISWSVTIIYVHLLSCVHPSEI